MLWAAGATLCVVLMLALSADDDCGADDWKLAEEDLRFPKPKLLLRREFMELIRTEERGGGPEGAESSRRGRGRERGKR